MEKVPLSCFVVIVEPIAKVVILVKAGIQLF